MSKSIKFTNDTYLDSSGVVFEKTALDKMLTYSTEEQIVGKWIDGKPIYRKVVPLNTFSNNGETTTNHNIDNLEYVINYSIHWYDTQDGAWYSNFKDTTGTYYIIFNGINSTVIKVKSLGGAIWSSRCINRYAILEYTKTTD